MKDRHDDLLAELRGPVAPLSDATIAAAQRDRVVRRLRTLQQGRQIARPRRSRRARGLALGAVLLTAGAAAATSGRIAAFFGASHEAVKAAPARVMAAEAPRAPVRKPLPEPSTPLTAPVVELGGPTPPTAKRPARPPARVAAKGSTLAEENALLERALLARSAGEEHRAVSLLEEHLGRYPESTLARNAELERLRALHRDGDPGAARAAARRYLARYPEGMGADEARRIAVGAMSSVRPSP